MKLVHGVVSLWANLVAIFAVLILTGLIHINVEPKIELLKPSYILDRACVKSRLVDFNYPLVDSIINTVFGGKSILLVDVPYPSARSFESGETVASYIQTNENDNSFRYKELTNGDKIFRSAEFVYDARAELKSEDGLQDISNTTIALQEDLTAQQKRIQTMPFFTNLVADFVGSNCQFVTTDSLLKIDESFRLFGFDPPPFLDKAVFDCRKVISILSLENYSSYDVKDLEIRIFKRSSISKDDNITLEAWTIEKSAFKQDQSIGKQLMIIVPVLRSKDDIQILVSSWLTNIKERDIILTYSKLGSLNKLLVIVFLTITLLISIFVQLSLRKP